MRHALILSLCSRLSSSTRTAEYAHRAAPFPLARVTSIDHLTILIRLNLAFHIMKKGKNIFVPLETMYYDLSEV